MNRVLFIFTIIILLYSHIGFTQKAPSITHIKGHVINEGEHVPFATIAIEGTTIGTTADHNGHYVLKDIPSGNFVLVAQSVGMIPSKKNIKIREAETIRIDFELEEDVISLNQVVVSSNRNETNRKEATTIVNTITSKLFETTNSISLAESMSFQPGLRVENNCQNCGFQQVRINGLDGPYSQILIDSRAIFSSLSGVYGIEQIPTSMIERVEVVRGGGSALFGSNAIAGTINIITKEPKINSFQLGSNHSIINKNSLDHNVNLNASLVSDNRKTGFFIFGSLRDRDYYDANNDGFSEIGLMENKTVGIRAFYKPTAYTKFQVEYHYLDEFRRGGNKFDFKPHESDITEQTNHKINSGGITYNWLSPDYKSKFSIYSSAQQTLRDSYYGAQQDANAYGNTKDLAFVTGGQYNYNFNKLLFAKSTITTGLEYQLNTLHDVMTGYNRDFSQEVHILGYFIQSEWETDKINFLLGGRLDKHNLIDKPIFSPRINLLYKINEHFSNRLTYSKGFRAPQAFDEDLHIMAIGGEATLIQLSEDLKTESSDSYSGSIDIYLNNNNIQINFLIEAFYTYLNNVFVVEEIGTDDAGNKILERRNGSGAKVYGLNTEARIAFSRQFQLQLGFTSQKSKYMQAEKWSDDELLEPTKNMLRTPDNYGYCTATYSPIKSTIFSISSIYTGQMYIPHYAGYIQNDILKQTDEYFELNTKIAHNFKIKRNLKLQINGGVQNILNHYQSDFDKGVYRDAGYIYGPNRPRTFFVGIKIGNNL